VQLLRELNAAAAAGAVDHRWRGSCRTAMFLITEAIAEKKDVDQCIHYLTAVVNQVHRFGADPLLDTHFVDVVTFAKGVLQGEWTDNSRARNYLATLAEPILTQRVTSSELPRELRQVMTRSKVSWQRVRDHADGFTFFIDPGDASPDDLRELLVALSDLHRAAGGEGLTFTVESDRVLIAELA
jgi:hypothetical protein